MLSAEVSLPTIQIQAIKNKQQIHFCVLGTDGAVMVRYNLKYRVRVYPISMLALT